MNKNCGKCSLLISIDTDPHTICEGECAKSFHASCVGVTETDLCALSSNIVWICDACMVSLCKWRERMTADIATSTEPTHSMEDEINDLKCKVAEIVHTLAEVVRNPDSIAPFRHSTPVSSPNLHEGTNETTDSASQQSVNNNDEFSLYLTNIDRNATEDDISLMVSRSLDAPISNCKDIVKLVPKWKNINTVDYISFKIVLNTKLKPVALNTSSWPKGIKFREFVNRSNYTWKPCH